MESFTKASSEQLNDFIAVIPDSILIQRENKIIFANPALLKLLGYSHLDEFLGLSPMDIVHPDSKDSAIAWFKAISEGNGIAPRMEQELVDKSGKKIDVEVDGFMFSTKGKQDVLALIRDIRLQKRKEEDLKENHFFLETAQQISRMGSWMYDLEPNGRLIWSKETYRIFGYDEPITNLREDDFYLRVHPEDKERVRKEIQDAVSQKAGYDVHFRILVPNVDIRWVKSKGELIKDKEGKPFKLIGVVQDVTESTLAELALVASERKFKGIFNGAVDAMAVIDNDGLILEVNPAATALLGETQEKLISKELKEFYDLSFDLEGTLKTVKQTGGTYRGEMWLKQANGDIRDVEIDVKGQILPEQNLVVIRDVTEEKRIRKQSTLNEKLATVGTLAAGVAHEINNPLGYVLGNLEILNELFEKNLKPNFGKSEEAPILGPEFYSEIKNIVLDAITGSQRIRDIVQGLKSFSRNNPDELTEVNVNNLVDSAISMTFHEIKYRAKVERNYDASLPLLVANVTKLQQVFVNMLINAAHAIPPGNTGGNFIRVETGVKEDRIFIRIRDTGKGIPPDILPRIFDPFFTTKPVGVGTGLGLSICHEIIRDYQGEIAVDSGEEKGTTFTVWLPLKNQRRVTGKFHKEAPREVEGLNVLLVDDEAGNIQLFSRMLRKKHFTISTESATDALKILDRGLTKVDVIITDLNMPDMNGIELYRKLEADHPHLVRRVVFITGGVFDPEMVQFLESVPNPKLDKPFQAEELFRAISQVAS